MDACCPHPCRYGICRRLRNKPLTSFKGSDTYLRIIQVGPSTLWHTMRCSRLHCCLGSKVCLPRLRNS